MKCVRVRVHGRSRAEAVISAVALKEHLAEMVKAPVTMVEDPDVSVLNAYEMTIHIGGNVITRWYWWWRVMRALKQSRWLTRVQVLYSV